MDLSFIGIFGILANFVLVAAVTILYRRTGQSIGVALFTGFLSLTPILILLAIVQGFLPRCFLKVHLAELNISKGIIDPASPVTPLTNGEV